MAGRLKHMQRSHYSYHNGTAGIYQGFERKAYAKRVKQAPGMSFLEKLINAVSRLKLPGFPNKNVKNEVKNEQ